MLPTVHPTEICTDPLNFFCAGPYLGLFYGAVLRVGAVLQRHHRNPGMDAELREPPVL